jgi:hypothetical protein
MEDWKSLIGNGNGVFCMFDDKQVDGTIYTEAYLTLLTNKSQEEYAGMAAEVAVTQGIFDNTATNKFSLMKMVKENVLRTNIATYLFNKQFFYNPSLAQGEVLGLIKAGNMSDFLTHADTIELTDVNGSDFLEFLL